MIFVCVYVNYGWTSHGNLETHWFYFFANFPRVMASVGLGAGGGGTRAEINTGQRVYARQPCTIHIISHRQTEPNGGKGQLLLFPGERCCWWRALARVPRRRRREREQRSCATSARSTFEKRAPRRDFSPFPRKCQSNRENIVRAQLPSHILLVHHARARVRSANTIFLKFFLLVFFFAFPLASVVVALERTWWHWRLNWMAEQGSKEKIRGRRVGVQLEPKYWGCWNCWK
jgi:hypothetical protein